MCNIITAVEELRHHIPIGTEVTMIGFFPEYLVKELGMYGFSISNFFDGMCYHAHIQRKF